MISNIITMCAMAGAIWSVFYWSKDRVFRITVIVSLALHGIMFAPFSKVLGINKVNTKSGYRAVNYIFVRGMPKNVEEIDKPEREKYENNENTDATKKSTGNIPSKKEILEKMVVKTETSVTIGNPDNTDNSDIEWFDFDKHPSGENYSKELNNLINANLEVPEELLRSGYEGKQIVFFKLSRNGELRAVFIPYNSLSLNSLVNETSIANIKRISEKFPPLPEGVKNEEIWFRVEINYAK